MIHELVPWAVIRKTQTIPPDAIIGNTEMAACIGIIYKNAGIESIPDFETPQELYDIFNEKMKNTDTKVLSETSLKMLDMLKEYDVLPMKNETIDDLKIILSISMK